ncbi:AI-2E family transporter [Spirosoma taeanense]|nr:AI-2E family transporter [Spirosoma taeanense]
MQALAKPSRFLFFLILLFGGLYFARTVLVPVIIGGLLAMLFLPLSNRLEKKGVSRAWAAFLCIVCLLALIAGIGGLLAWQSSELTRDLSGVEDRISEWVGQLKEFIRHTVGIEPQQQQKLIQQQQASGGGQVSRIVMAILDSLLAVAVDTVLVLVYLFLLLYFRNHLRSFVLQMVSTDKQPETRKILQESSEVAQQYLAGLAAMITALWVLYGIGFSIVGVKHAIFLAILCGLLEMIPFIGNLTGTALAILVTMAQGGDTNTILGILVVYGVVQFTQTYIIEPLVVGNEVSINPLFTILVIVVGEAVWGIPGMILALPMLGIIKVICDHVEPLRPYGFLIGKVGSENETSLGKKLKQILHIG